MATRKSSAAAPAAQPVAQLQGTTSPTTAALADIGQCLQLPLAPDGAAQEVPDFEPGTIQRFKDTDRTTMMVVAVGGAFHKTPA